MRVFQAETGRAIQLATPIDSLDAFKHEIHAVTGISPNAQIILTLAGAQLKPDTAPAVFAANASNRQEDTVLFVFNRQLLDPRSSWTFQRSSLTLESPVNVEAVTWLPLPAMSPSVSLAQISDDFTSLFRAHTSLAEALWNASHSHAQICEVLMEEQHVQAEALGVALTNLQGHNRVLSEVFDLFNSHAHRELSKHSNLLQSFETDLLALQKIPIHPSISNDHKTLADYVPHDKLRVWAENCRTAHDSLLKKTASLSETMSSIRAGTESEMRQPMDADFPKLESLLASVRELMPKMDQRRQIFERDLARVEGILRQTGKAGSIQQASDKLLALEHLANIHRDEYIPEMVKAERYIRDTVTYFRDSKTHVSTQMISRLQSISSLQSSIASASPLLNTLNSNVSAQSTAFAQLLHVHRMPSAWGATLVEIVRRREYAKVFLSRAKEMAEILSKFRAQEERRRETFKAEIGAYLPAGLIRGLDDKPPYCEISVSGTKDGLPLLAKEDILDFEKLVSSIRSSIMEPSGPSGSTSSAPDAVTKLQATMVRMSPQVDGTAAEFDRIIVKSSLGESLRRIEDENTRLRAELAKTGSGSATSPSLSRKPGLAPTKSVSIGPADGRDITGHQDISRAEDTLKAYEKRIKSLESSLRDAYQAGSKSQMEGVNMSAEVVQFQEQLSQMQKENADVRATMRREIGKRELESVQVADSLKSLLASLGRHVDVDSDISTLLGDLHDQISNGRGNSGATGSHGDPNLLSASRAQQQQQGLSSSFINRSATSKLNTVVTARATSPMSNAPPIPSPLHTSPPQSSDNLNSPNSTDSAAMAAAEDWVFEKATYETRIRELEAERDAVKNDLEGLRNGNVESVRKVDEVGKVAVERIVAYRDGLRKIESVNSSSSIYSGGVVGVQEQPPLVENDTIESLRRVMESCLTPEGVEEQVNHVVELLAKLNLPEDSRITFQNFKIGDLALFLPTQNPKALCAFHVSAPHYFLSLESAEMLDVAHRAPSWILARLVSIRDMLVDSSNPSTNPFTLRDKSVFHLCDVVPWEGLPGGMMSSVKSMSKISLKMKPRPQPGKTPLFLFDTIHRNTCSQGYHDFVSRAPPITADNNNGFLNINQREQQRPDDISNPVTANMSDKQQPDNQQEQQQIINSIIINSKHNVSYICKRCLSRMAITLPSTDETSVGECAIATGTPKYHHWHTMPHDVENPRAERVEKCCACDLRVVIRLENPCVPQKQIDMLDKYGYPEEADNLLTLFMRLTFDCVNGVDRPEIKIKADNPKLKEKTKNLTKEADQLFQLLGFEKIDEHLVYTRRGDPAYQNLAEKLRDELTLLYEKNRVRLPPTQPPSIYASELWEASEAILSKLDIPLNLTRNGIKTPAAKLLKELEGVSEYNFNVLGSLCYAPDNGDETVIWAYTRNAEEFPDQIPYFMDALVNIAKWRNTEDLQNFVAIERSKGSHPMSDIRSAFRTLRIEDAHIGIQDAPLCRNFEWTFMTGNPPGNLDEAKQALKLIGEARKSDIISNFVDTGMLPPDEALPPSAPMEIDENEINMPAGLDNIGNTCFLNSLLQCYFAIRPLRDAVLGFVPPPPSQQPVNMKSSSDASIEEQTATQIPNGDVLNDSTISTSNNYPSLRNPLLSNESSATLNDSPMDTNDGTTTTTPINTDNADLSKGKPSSTISVPIPPSTSIQHASSSQDPEITRAQAVAQHLERSKELVMQMQVLFASLIWTNFPSIKPQKVLADIALTSEGLRFGLQQDVGECHSRLTASLEVALKSASDVSNAGLINNLFTGKLQQRLDYVDEAAVQQARHQEEEFAFLLLNVAKDLNQALDSYFMPEMLSDFKGAKAGTRAFKTTTITQFPPVLMINIQRSMFNKESHMQYKQHEYVKYPPVLYLDRFMESSDPEFKAAKQQDAKDRYTVAQWEQFIQTQMSEGQILLQGPGVFHSTFENAREYFKSTMSNDDPRKPRVLELFNSLHLRIHQKLNGYIQTKDEIVKSRMHRFDTFKKWEYHLQAVFMHEGEANFGHYWLYLFDPALKRWLKCNDSRVTEVPDSEVFLDTSGTKKSAYCLVYVQASQIAGILDSFVRNPKSREEYEALFPQAKDLAQSAAPQPPVTTSATTSAAAGWNDSGAPTSLQSNMSTDSTNTASTVENPFRMTTSDVDRMIATIPAPATNSISPVENSDGMEDLEAVTLD
ncbi:hypothetical protein SmJEL517_g06033 [Synchytrium microbalum]|uniref:USP domain-containing protein n=1 Tax=Synchytrium microbalum TaxID=1806994 RepID=A0A507BSS5_9FUNG|nr:uncharacterized protein SmJEL517_g06033 [Synchytrium microbalum]TPX30381.1 hypothetical protein SmJEL517_g06033 [Synchytrium microbalum]